MRVWVYVIGVAIAFAAACWASDFITLQGERTVYTVECRNGTWQGRHCSGRLVAADRYTFRVSPTRGEVLFWTVGTPSGAAQYSGCLVHDGRNWTCKPAANGPATITLQMVHGRPVPEASAVVHPFHAVAKWRWWLLRFGLSAGRDAMA